jgi:hypothetical protein
MMSESPAGEEELKRLMLHNLALLHANDKMPYDDLLNMLNDEYMTHHA